MTLPPLDPEPAPLDALEFELTDLQQARQALDELPPGVMTAQTLAPDYWPSHRRRPTATDRALTGAAIDWLLGLPAQLRPTATCERFPRIVNAMAACWTRPAEREVLLAQLLHDKRRQRVGFPPPVRAEIQALHEAVSSGP
jgi:hypothetical protein